ncbi:CLUMA_CG008398, isoform A [Clunio marinus]|uniref:CLUMA_CG008398, isoform A n=1 Tax=Clunio marinus TaxID=568069 RepID=A0A1J1I576_9DIPT|nr:CLUMA_CG008398, isoform A [Clunio marinus]
MDSKDFKIKKELKRKKRQEKLIKEAEHYEAVKKAKIVQKEQEKIQKNIKYVSTVSIAISGSILDNAQSPELRTYLAGQIARAACIYNIDEIVIFDDQPTGNVTTTRMQTLETTDGVKTARTCCIQFARILQYLECPQYLRKFFFPLHNDLKFSGLLNPLDSQHHLRATSEFIYREGITTNKPHPKGSFVNVGLLNDVLVNKQLAENLRVTVKLPPNTELKSKKLRGIVVSPSEPRRATGIYWGYNVRVANSISQVFSQSPYPEGYDVTIGTSDKGENVQEVETKSVKFNHLLIVFGGLLGLENAVENDDELNVDDPSLLFDHYFNVVPQQGSRTIRTEEAVLITLSSLAEKIEPMNAPPEFKLKDLIAQSEDTGNVQTFREPMKRKNKIQKKKKEISDCSGESSDNNYSANDNDMSRFD